MTDDIYRVIKSCFTEYKHNINREALNQQWELVDALLVGSITTESFVPGESDVDVCVVLSIPACSGIEPGMILGFDAYLEEDCAQRVLNTVHGDPVRVDAGVYTKRNVSEYIEDSHVYSTKKEKKAPVESFTHLQT